MVGLQTSHRYGNATFLESDFVLGIGNRWANRHTGTLDVYTKGRTFVHVDIEPTQIGRIFAPGLRHRLRRQGRAGALRRGGEGAARPPAGCRDRGAWAAATPGAQGARCSAVRTSTTCR